MQQTALLPDVVRVQQSSVLVKEASWQQALGLLAEMQQLLFCLSHCLLCHHQCLREGTAVAAGIGPQAVMAVMQQTALLPDVVRVQQSSVLVKEASNGSRP